MLNRYYQEELQNLRTLGAAYAKAHPALAPMLAQPSTDPDVERLLEGVAFLTGLVRGRMDADFPELVHGLLELAFPQVMRPVPACSIVAFSPKPSAMETLKVPAGVSLGSVPVDGVECRFRTAWPLEVHPLRVVAAETLIQTGQPDRIRLRLELKGLPLSHWKPTELGFFLGESYGEAADLFLLLKRHLRRITVSPASGGKAWEVPEGSLSFPALELDRSLLPCPPQSFRGFRLIHDYFALPQVFLLGLLKGWQGWTQRGEGCAFEILFEFAPGAPTPKRVHPGNFVLHATPVVNLYAHEAEPIALDHRRERVMVRPAGRREEQRQIYSVDKVMGFAQGSSARREYLPLGLFQRHNGHGSLYQSSRCPSPLDGRQELFLSFTYPPEEGEPLPETLSVALTCTNGDLPARLQPGDICRPTESSPELLSFGNLLAPTPPLDPPLGDGSLWQLLSQFSLNLLGLQSAATFQELMRLHAQRTADRAALAANLKRVEGVTSFRTRPGEHLERGQVLRGREVDVGLREDCFASPGDLHLFGCVLDRFLAAYASLNCFTRLNLRESQSGRTLSWPARIGERPLL